MKTITLNDISRFDFNLCIVFLALWEERSVSKAAQRLSLSQSAVSMALARLRETVGDPLFVRTRGCMQPTPRAIAMAGPLETGAAIIRDAFRPDAPFDPATSHQRFSIGMSDDFQLAAGPLIAERVRAEAPHVSVVFRQTNRQTVEAAFDADEIDLAVVAQSPAHSWLAVEEIGESGYACLLDPDASGAEPPLALETYLALPHVLVSFSGREGIVDQALRRIGRRRHVQTALTHFAALPNFLAGTRAVATLPSHAAHSIADISGLTVCESPLELGRYRISLLCKRTTNQDWMRQIIRDIFREVLR